MAENYDEIDDDDDDAEDDLNDVYGEDLENEDDNLTEKSKLTKTLSGGNMLITSSTLINDFDTTPLSSDKRSRSLISLRRRRWSASSNRSSSAASTHNHQQINEHKSSSKHQQQQQQQQQHQFNHKINNFINIEDRSRRKLFTNNNKNNQNNTYFPPNNNNKSNINNTTNFEFDKSYGIRGGNLTNQYNNHNNNTSNLNNFSKSSNIRNLRIAPNLNSTEIYSSSLSYKNNRNQNSRFQKNPQSGYNISSSRQNRTNVTSMSSRTKSSNLNVTTSATNISMNLTKFTKNLRKSFNDLYSATANKLNNTTLNLKKDEHEATFTEKEASNKYTKGLKSIKNRLIKTKNNLFNRNKRKSASMTELNKIGASVSVNAESKQTHMATQSTSKIVYSDQNSDQENNKIIQSGSSIGEQSFVNNVKMKFLKRNRSSKSGSTSSNTDNRINSTALSTKLSNTYLNSNQNHQNTDTMNRQVRQAIINHQIYEHSPNKRPKFY
jgi:hypothetical protein